jgi:hypothetical protein
MLKEGLWQGFGKWEGSFAQTSHSSADPLHLVKAPGVESAMALWDRSLSHINVPSMMMAYTTKLSSVMCQDTYILGMGIT